MEVQEASISCDDCGSCRELPLIHTALNLSSKLSIDHLSVFTNSHSVNNGDGCIPTKDLYFNSKMGPST